MLYGGVCGEFTFYIMKFVVQLFVFSLWAITSPEVRGFLFAYFCSPHPPVKNSDYIAGELYKHSFTFL